MSTFLNLLLEVSLQLFFFPFFFFCVLLFLLLVLELFFMILLSLASVISINLLFLYIPGLFHSCNNQCCHVLFFFFLTNRVCLCHLSSPLNLGCRIHRLHFFRRVRAPSTSVLHMTLNHLMARLLPKRFGECGVPLHCHCSQIYSDPEW